MPTELREGVWWLSCTGVNAYLVADDDGLTLVDTGTPLDAARIEASIVEAGLDPSGLRRVLVTHYDVDHVGGAADLTGDLPIHVGAADADLLTGARRPVPTGLKSLTQLVTWPLVRRVADGRVRRVDDGDEIGGFTAYHAPGHTPGHTVYVHEECSAAFLGDAVVERGGSLRLAPWFITADVAENRRSVRELPDRLPDVEVAAMGHGTPFESGGTDRLAELVTTL